MLGSVLQTALSGIAAAEFAIGVSANNLANAHTDGFKSSRAIAVAQQPGPNKNVGRGVRSGFVETNHSQGAMVIDNSPLHLALQGEGFFTLDAGGEGRRYSRNGNFQLNAGGEIVSSTGARLLGFKGDHQGHESLQPLRIDKLQHGVSLTGVEIDGDGGIRVRLSDGSDRSLGRVAIAHFANPNGLVASGNNLYAEGDNSGLPVYGRSAGSAVLGGARELSNVDIASELIDVSVSSLSLRANLQVLETGVGLLDEIMNLRRL